MYLANFDMPAKGTWEERGGWVVRQVAGLFALTLEQAAGIVGNLGFESAGFTKLQEMVPVAGRGGYGWAQWTGPRRRAFEAYAKKLGMDPASDRANFEYLCYEIDEPFNYVLDDLDAHPDDVVKCTFIVGEFFEAPGGTTSDHLPGYAGRLSYAKRALAGAKASQVNG